MTLEMLWEAGKGRLTRGRAVYVGKAASQAGPLWHSLIDSETKVCPFSDEDSKNCGQLWPLERGQSVIESANSHNLIDCRISSQVHTEIAGLHINLMCHYSECQTVVCLHPDWIGSTGRAKSAACLLPCGVDSALSCLFTCCFQVIHIYKSQDLSYHLSSVISTRGVFNEVRLICMNCIQLHSWPGHGSIKQQTSLGVINLLSTAQCLSIYLHIYI